MDVSVKEVRKQWLKHGEDKERAKFKKYEIRTKFSPDIKKHPHQFFVKVNKLKLIKMVIKEIFKYGFNFKVALSRPCVYGVFSRPVGGLAPIHEKCVGCLRCTMQYPDVVQIHINPEWLATGDKALTPHEKSTILYEARTGRVPVKGAGYPGKYGGTGWDSLLTDMSEIVRPTRDGIYGREYISTRVDIGISYPSIKEGYPKCISIEVPFIIDCTLIELPYHVLETFLIVCRECRTAVALTLNQYLMMFDKIKPDIDTVFLCVNDAKEVIKTFEVSPKFKVIFSPNYEIVRDIGNRLGDNVITGIRVPISMWREVAEYAHSNVLWFYADYFGYDSGVFIKDYLMECHNWLVDKGLRSRTTIIASGGINTAEHIPKAILCGSNACALNIPLWIALQSNFKTEELKPWGNKYPKFLEYDIVWGVQRIKNLFASWRNQLLEVAGAMGIRDIRRMCGEHGRLLPIETFEREAFSDIEGYPTQGYEWRNCT